MPPTLGPRRVIRDREADARRRRVHAWRGWYNLRIWRQVIRPRELAKNPLCARCLALDIVEPSVIVDHVGGHKGDWSKFINGPFETMCKTHHDSVVQAEERQAEAEAARA